MRRLAILTAALLVPAMAIAASDASRGLFVAFGAVEVARHSAKGSASVEYYVKEAYPAEATLAFIRSRLESAGFRPVRGRDLYKDDTTSIETGWTDLPGQKVAVAGRVWSARWVDVDRNEVVYTLSYSSPQGEEGMKPTHVSVAAWYHDRKTAAQVRKATEEVVERLKNSARRPPD